MTMQDKPKASMTMRAGDHLEIMIPVDKDKFEERYIFVIGKDHKPVSYRMERRKRTVAHG